MSIRADMLRRLLLLSFAAAFHVLLMLHVRAGASVRLGMPVWPWPAAMALMLLVTGLALLWESRTLGPLCAAATAFVPLPWYLVILPLSWAAAVCGMAVCVYTALRVMHALPSRTEGGVGDAVHTNAEDQAPGGREGIRAWGELVGCVAFLTLVAGFILFGREKCSPSVLILFWIFLGAAVPVGLVWEYAEVRTTREGRYHRRLILPLFAAICLVRPDTRRAAAFLLLLQQAYVLWRVWRNQGGKAVWAYLMERPAHLLVGSFAAAILVGSLFLSLPSATRGPEGLRPVDALFTATSATCVTGLIVVDTGRDLSGFGQAVVLALIQAGGLGIMTVSTFVALLLGRNIGLREEFALTRTLGEERTSRARRLVWFIVMFTVLSESIGGALLTLRFCAAGIPWPQCLWVGMFHSVSAFCNAGFSLFSDSLTGFVQGGNALIPLIVSVLIILGGLGFGVIYSLAQSVSRGRRPGFHVRVVLISTALLLAGGTLVLWILESRRTFAGGTFGESLLHAWFQSVTARTAGFNTVPIGEMQPASLMVLMVLMFIGAAPGSTAGGVKVTTVAVLGAAILSMTRGRRAAVLGGRRLAPRTLLNAAVLICVAGTAVVIVGILLAAREKAAPLPLLFEAVSAFGTVGLSCGVTSHLTAFGKLLLIGLMFAGRVGPLTLLVLMQPRDASRVDYPVADVVIG